MIKSLYIERAESFDFEKYKTYYRLSLLCKNESRQSPKRHWFKYYCPICGNKLHTDAIHYFNELQWVVKIYTEQADAKYYKCNNCGYEFAEAKHNDEYETWYHPQRIN